MPNAVIDPVAKPHYFAITLDRIALDRSRREDEEKSLRDHVVTRAEWLQCLTSLPNLAFDLRYICDPSVEHYRKGTITIVLIGRIEGSAADDAQAIARNVFDLCRAYFEDLYEFSLITLESEIARFRVPFDIAHAAEVLRRTEQIRLDTLQPTDFKNPLGFARPGKKAYMPKVGVMHVYPFISLPRSFEKLFRLMLMQRSRTAICFSLRPTLLTKGETDALEDQIRTCETFAQTGVSGTSASLCRLSPTLQERARILQRHLTNTLFGLNSAAVLLRTTVIGEESVSQVLVDALAMALTLPPGGLGTAVEGFICGGYETRTYKDDQIAGLIDELAEIDLRADRSRYLFQPKEASNIFALPVAQRDGLPGLKSKNFSTRLIPASCETDGQLIGHSGLNGSFLPVHLDDETRRRHVYALGQTGTGKSTLLESMALSDMRANKGVCVIDPHGDLAEQLLAKIPAERAKDVIYLDAASDQCPFGINPLECQTEEQKHFLIQEMLAIVKRTVREYDPAFIGPVFLQHSRFVLQLVMSNPKKIGTLVQFYQVFCKDSFYLNFLPLTSSDPLLRSFVEDTLVKTNYTSQGSDQLSLGSYLSSKYEPFLGDPILRNIFGQRRSTISFDQVIRDKKILIINLSKGRLGDLNSQFLGMILIAKLQSAAMAQAGLKYEDRNDFYLYVDEFQNLATENFSSILAEARKYKLCLTLTNQFASQIDQKIRDAIAGNVGTTISFRVGSTDAESMQPQFRTTFSRHDLMNLPNFHAYVSTLSRHEVSTPFSMTTLYDPAPGNAELAADIRERSRLVYGRKREDVEREIEESLFLSRERKSIHEYAESNYG